MGGRPGGPAEPAAAPGVVKMLENGSLVKLHRLGLIIYYWIKSATKRSKTWMRRRKRELCPKCQRRWVQKMLALQPGMDRLNHELSAQRDRLVRLQSVQTDLALDLPPSIPLPDGEEIPYGSATRLQIRDQEQESEIYQKCIRPPPNKTIFDGESPPPYRSSSAGLLASDWSSSSSSGNLVVRCHSVSGPPSKRPADILGRTVRCLSGKRCHFPVGDESSVVLPSSRTPSVSVVVPSHRCRRLSAFSDAAGSSLVSLPTVQCSIPVTCVASPEPCPEERSRSHSVGESPCENRTIDNKNKCDRSTV